MSILSQFFIFILLASQFEALANTNLKPHKVCRNAVQQGDYKLALSQCVLQLHAVQSLNDSKALFHFYFSLIDIHHHIENNTQEKIYINKIINHPDYAFDTAAQYELNRRQGRRNLKNSNLQSASKFLQAGFDIAKKENNIVWLSKSYNDIGGVAKSFEDYQKALEYYKKSLTLKTKLNDLYMMATTQRNIGTVYTELDEHEKAVLFYEQALKSYNSYTNIDGFDNRVSESITHIYEDLALAYSKVNNKQDSKKYSQLILQTFESKISKRDQSRALLNLAKIDRNENKFLPAKTKLFQSLMINEDNSYTHTQETHFELAQTLKKLDQTDEAISYAIDGLKFGKDKKDNKINLKLHKLLSELYYPDAMEKAFVHLNTYQQKRAEFLEKKYKYSLQNIQHQIELQQKEKQLTDIKLNNALKNSKIKKLQFYLVLFLMCLSSVIGFTAFILLKRKKEKEQLLNSINYHKQQTILLESKHKEPNKNLSLDFKIHLVKSMNDVVRIWEHHSKTNRVELADRSKAWTISVDNGTLRTRSLDKYMNINSIPKNPRWKNVVKTYHYLLSLPELPQKERELLSTNLDQITNFIQRKSMNNQPKN